MRGRGANLRLRSKSHRYHGRAVRPGAGDSASRSRCPHSVKQGHPIFISFQSTYKPIPSPHSSKMIESSVSAARLGSSTLGDIGHRTAERSLWPPHPTEDPETLGIQDHAAPSGVELLLHGRKGLVYTGTALLRSPPPWCMMRLLDPDASLGQPRGMRSQGLPPSCRPQPPACGNLSPALAPPSRTSSGRRLSRCEKTSTGPSPLSRGHPSLAPLLHGGVGGG